MYRRERSNADARYAHFHDKETADGVADCRGFVLIEDGAHFLSRTRLEPIKFDLQELSEALAVTTLGFAVTCRKLKSTVWCKERRRRKEAHLVNVSMSTFAKT